METWKEENNRIVKHFVFADFETAMQFMQMAAKLISTLDHHPTWTNTYNSIRVELTTHEAGNTVTEKDWQLAKMLDEIKL